MTTHEYKFQQVTGKPFTTTCIACGYRIEPGDGSETRLHGPHFADLNGEPFKAYYCRDCALQANEYKPL